jgi:hypothetical protein
MALQLPDPPESLDGAPRRFYDELRRMLDSVRPSQIDPERTSVTFDGNGVEVEFVHLERDGWSISATVGERHAIVATLGAHEDFFGPASGEDEDRPWTTQIVDFVAEILRGQIEVERTYRGRTPIYARHYSLDPTGRRQSLGHTGLLTPARLFLWQPKRTETERASWL